MSKLDSSLPLALKYRPPDFDSFVGNEATVESLKSVLGRETGRPHSLMFSGNSGCGKTTLARIAGKELGCSERDFAEYNAANTRGIDTIREVNVKCHYAPMEGKVKVYLFDEAAGLTVDAQHALLKLLEDTPAHVYFMLCTTAPDKLLRTIRTRCEHFRVKSLHRSKLVGLLKDVCSKEIEGDFPAEVLEKIADVSEGSPRQALVILDQVIDIPDDKMMLEAVGSVARDSSVIELCRALMLQRNDKWKVVSSLLQNLDEDPERVRRAVLGYFNSVLLRRGGSAEADVIDCFFDNFYDSGKAGLTLACYRACAVK